MTVSVEEQSAMASYIKRAIGVGALMSLGASNFMFGAGADGLGALYFHARILPVKKNGERASRPQKMFVEVSYNSLDTFDIKVTNSEFNTHYELEGAYIDDLQRLMLALDYDGDTVLNPRYK